MKAIIEPNFMADGYSIWFLDGMGRVAAVGELGFEWNPYEPGTQPPPTYTLRKELFELLMEAGQKHVPETHSMSVHLKREIELSDWMRDRIDVLSEMAFSPPLIVNRDADG